MIRILLAVLLAAGIAACSGATRIESLPFELGSRAVAPLRIG